MLNLISGFEENLSYKKKADFFYSSSSILNIAGEIIRISGEKIACTCCRIPNSICKNNMILLYDMNTQTTKKISCSNPLKLGPLNTCELQFHDKELLTGANHAINAHISQVLVWNEEEAKAVIGYPGEGKLSTFDFSSTEVIIGYDRRKFRVGTYSNKIIDVIDRSTSKVLNEIISNKSEMVYKLILKNSLLINSFGDSVQSWDLREPSKPVNSASLQNNFVIENIRELCDQQIVLSTNSNIFSLDFRKPNHFFKIGEHAHYIQSIDIVRDKILSNAINESSLNFWDKDGKGLLGCIDYLDTPTEYYTPSNIAVNRDLIGISDHQIQRQEKVKVYQL